MTPAANRTGFLTRKKKEAAPMMTDAPESALHEAVESLREKDSQAGRASVQAECQRLGLDAADAAAGAYIAFMDTKAPEIEQAITETAIGAADRQFLLSRRVPLEWALMTADDNPFAVDLRVYDRARAGAQQFLDRRSQYAKARQTLKALTAADFAPAKAGDYRWHPRSGPISPQIDQLLRDFGGSDVPSEQLEREIATAIVALRESHARILVNIDIAAGRREAMPAEPQPAPRSQTPIARCICGCPNFPVRERCLNCGRTVGA